MTLNIDTGRRKFLGTSIGAGAATIIASHTESAEAANIQNTPNTYPVISIMKLEQMTKMATKSFNYPDASSPCILIKLDSPVDAGIGPEKNIVAYSSMCTHMGCIVSYDTATQTFQCPCHFSVFDPGNNGQMVCGQATEDLPRIQLSHDAKTGQIAAVGVQGRIYGRISNVL